MNERRVLAAVIGVTTAGVLPVATATGITQTGTYTGGAVGPLVFGIIVERAGYGVAWWIFAGVAVTAVAVMLVGRRLIDPAPLVSWTRRPQRSSQRPCVERRHGDSPP